jgi:CheY-like chemotaxis protein
VLVIDDEQAVRTGLRLLLQEWGCECDAVKSIDEALATARQHAPDLVISDYRLRGHATGAQAIQALRGLLGQSLPGLLITGDTAPERLVEAQASGIPLLHKPVPPEELRRQLHALLEGAGA